MMFLKNNLIPLALVLTADSLFLFNRVHTEQKLDFQKPILQE